MNNSFQDREDKYKVAGPQGTRTPPSPDHAFVDRIEGDRAVLVHGENVHDVHISTLPPGTKEGDWIHMGDSKYKERNPNPESDTTAKYRPWPPGDAKL